MAGTLGDVLDGGDDLDRQLARLSSATEVEAALARLRAELGTREAVELPIGREGSTERP
jgi:hypothetical protein